MLKGVGRIPEEIWRAFREQRDSVNRRGPQLGGTVKMLQLTTSSQATFIVIDALDECTAVHRPRLFDSWKEVPGGSSNARIWVTGTPQLLAEVDRRLAGRVTSVFVGPARDDIVRFLRASLSDDEIPDAMDLQSLMRS